MRGATTPTKKSRIRTAFQSTLLMRGATASAEYANIYVDISIHAPHARSDSGHPQNRQLQHISIHAPHARSDATVADVAVYYKTFQSTLLMRGATGLNSQNRGKQCHFNPRSSCEERRASQRTTTSARYFNPRSSCEERLAIVTVEFSPIPFQSTLLMRGATPGAFRPMATEGISIHAPHARSDPGRHCAPVDDPRFQSTLLMRGATAARLSSICAGTISIHAPHARSDCTRHTFTVRKKYFNPRSSCEERRRLLPNWLERA